MAHDRPWSQLGVIVAVNTPSLEQRNDFTSEVRNPQAGHTALHLQEGAWGLAYTPPP